MPLVLFALVILVVAIFAITIIGHFIWLVVAAFVQALRSVELDQPTGGSTCPQCGILWRSEQGTCIQCGYGTQRTVRQEIQTTIRTLNRLHLDGKVSMEQLGTLKQVLTTEYEHLDERHKPKETSHTPFQKARSPSLPPATASDEASSRAIEETREFIGDGESDRVLGAANDLNFDGEIVEAEVIEPAVPLTTETDDSVDQGVVRKPAVPVRKEYVPSPSQPRAESAAFSPRRTMADILQTFMEEKNIRWGELASGILIVGSAIGLIVSLRTTLQTLSDKIPYFSALLLMLGTVLIHLAGLYTLRRWKLRSTSRGILIIATLLVPLSFAAGILLSGTGGDRPEVNNWLYFAAVTIGMLGYGVVTSLSAQALFPSGWWRITLAVMGTSAGQLVINRLGENESAATVVFASALFAVPMTAFLVAVLSQIERTANWLHFTPSKARQTFTVLGIACFALCVPLTLQLSLSGSANLTMASLSPMLSMAAAAILAVGITVQQRAEPLRMSGVRWAGTTIALMGGLIMVGTALSAWPDPVKLIAVTTVTAVSLFSIALISRIPIFHGAAVFAASFAGLLFYHHQTGALDSAAEPTATQLVHLLLMGRSSLLLLVPSCLASAAGWVLSRRQASQTGIVYLGTAAVLSIMGFVIALYAGFAPAGEDRNLATVVFGAYAILGLVMVPWVKRPAVTWGSSAALLLALVHIATRNTQFSQWLLAQQWSLNHPLTVAFLVHGLMISLYGLLLVIKRSNQQGTGTGPGNADVADTSQIDWLASAPVSGGLTAALTIPSVLLVRDQAFGEHGLYLAAVAIIWAMSAAVVRSAMLATAAHAVTVVAIVFATAAAALHFEWPGRLMSLQHWQLQMSVLAISSFMATGLRLATQRWPRVQQLIHPRWPTVDQVVLGALSVGVTAVALLSCWPGIVNELGFANVSAVATTNSWHAAAGDDGTWLALICIVSGIALLLYEHWSDNRLFALVTATVAAPLLFACRFEDSVAVASAMRWLLASYTLVWVLFLAYAKQWFGPSDEVTADESRTSFSLLFQTRDLAGLFGVASVIIVSVAALMQAVSGVTFGGPVAESLFGRMPITLLYGAPLAILAVAMLVIAVRDRLPGFALLSSVLVQFVTVMVVALPALVAGQPWNQELFIMLIQWCAVTLAAFSLLWLGLAKYIHAGHSATEDNSFSVQMFLSMVLPIAIAATAAMGVTVHPESAYALTGWPTQGPTFLAAGLASIVAFWVGRGRQRLMTLTAVITPAVFVALVAATMCKVGPWFGYHLLTGGFMTVALGCTVAWWWTSKRTPWATAAATLDTAATISAWTVFALLVRACHSDPLAVRFTIICSIGLFAIFALLGIRHRSSLHTYWSAIVSLFACSVVWTHLADLPGRPPIGFIYANTITASVVATFWLLVEVWSDRRRDRSSVARHMLPSVHSLLTVLATFMMTFVCIGLSMSSVAAEITRNGGGIALADGWGLAALVALGLSVFGLWWDRQARGSLLTSYLWGYLAVGLVMNYLQQHDVLGPGRDGAIWSVLVASVLVAAFVALTGHLWKWGKRASNVKAQWYLPGLEQQYSLVAAWLPILNVLATAAICGIGFYTVLAADQWPMRLTITVAPLLLAYGTSCLVLSERQQPAQLLTLALLVVAAIFLGWVELADSAESVHVLSYSARLVTVLAGMTCIYSLLAHRLGQAHLWFKSVRQSTAILVVGTVITLAIVLALEVAYFRPGIGAPLATVDVISTSLMLLAFVIALLAMAVLPERDPFAISDKGRQAYVYCAQVMAAVLFAHIYLAKPQLFTFGLLDYWPYLVMAIAFTSVAVAEICDRRGLQVISEPLHRTGGFLPLLPALSAWAFSDATSYPLVLFFAGLFYVALSVSRRSVAAGIAAAIMGNGALWALFNEQGLRLTAQPQLWLIPPALSALAASYINRDRLSSQQMTAIRYICVMVIYLSSTGEMFMKLMGSNGNWTGPLFLTTLSVAGIFAGIMLRVRAFLYLGTSFLVMSVVGMVWNAQRAVGHVWPWWVFGITLGLAILLLFGLFEKHRQEMRQLIVRLRQWEP